MIPVTVTATVPASPGETLSVPGEIAREKSGGGLTTMLCDTVGAAAKFVLPAWFAATTTVPVPVNVNVLPLRLAIVPPEVMENVTARPELAVAVRVTVPVPRTTGDGGAGKVIVCAAWLITRVCVTGVAAE